MLSRAWAEIIRRRSGASRVRHLAAAERSGPRQPHLPGRGPSAIDLVADGLLGIIGSPRRR